MTPELRARIAGLLCVGDFRVAARILATQDDETGLRELARFAVSDDYLRLRTKLVG